MTLHLLIWNCQFLQCFGAVFDLSKKQWGSTTAFLTPLPHCHRLTHILSRCRTSYSCRVESCRHWYPVSLPLQMAECLPRAQPDSVANHVKARQSPIERAVMWLATESSWTRGKRSAICSGKLSGGFIIFVQCFPCAHCPLPRKCLIFYFKIVHSDAFSYTNSKVLFAIKCRERHVITVFLATDGNTDMKKSSFHQSRKLIPIQSVSSNSHWFHSYSRHVL